MALPLYNKKTLIQRYEEKIRTAAGETITISEKTSPVANASATVDSFYNTAKEPEQDAFTYTTNNREIQAFVRFVTEEEVSEIEGGDIQAGDAKVEVSIDEETYVTNAVNNKYEITIGSDKYICVSASQNSLKTKIEMYCKKILND